MNNREASKRKTKNLFIEGYIKSAFIQHIVVLIFIFSSILYSEETEPDYSKFVLGIKSGISFSNFIGNDTKTYDPEFNNGLSLGGFMDFEINNYLSLQFELNYIEKGSEGFEEFIEFYDSESYWNPGQYFKEKVLYSYELNYFELAVLLKYHTKKISEIYPVIYCGLSAAENTKAEINIRDGGISEFMEIVEDEQEIMDFVEDRDCNAIYGASFDYRLNKSQIILDFRYNMGLNKIFKDIEFDFKSSVFIFSVGYGYMN